ncbi:MAG: phosphatase PAP2 family protein [Pirellulales bacterium]|nr:phosphatase PAP2 family protein [Pirellulales bacterium]
MIDSEGFRDGDLRRDAPHRGRDLASASRGATSLARPPQSGSIPAASGIRPWPRRSIALLLLASLGALSIDMALARWCAAGNVPKNMHRLLETAEDFGNGFGVVLIALAIGVLDPARRRALVRVLTAAYGAGLAANAVKILLVRFRPRELNLVASGLSDTFGGVLGLGDGRSHSFPSAHTATAVGLALLLGWLYPRGRWYFAALAVLVGAQRVAVGAHFLSDVLVGAALGLAVGWCCTGWQRGAERFTRFETRGALRAVKSVGATLQ